MKRRNLACSFLLTVWAGCSFDSSGQEAGADGASAAESTTEREPTTSATVGGREESDSTTGQDDSTTSGGTEPGPVTDTTASETEASTDTDVEPAVLVDDELLVRYYLAEQASGEPTSALSDAGPAPVLDLVSYYAAGSMQPEFVTKAGNRGLHWTTAGSDGRVGAPVGTMIADTKLWDLVGSTAVTFEVVIEPESAAPNLSRIVSFERPGMVSVNLMVGLTPDGEGFSLSLIRQTLLRARWPVPAQPGRIVIHVVVETTLSGDEQLRAFIDGALVAPVELMPFDEGHTLGLNDDSTIVLGNRPPYQAGAAEDRALGGTLFYAAVYGEALADEDIAHNAELLLESDDPPS